MFSAKSWSELARDGKILRSARAGEAAELPFIAQQLGGATGPVIAATDYVRAFLTAACVRAYWAALHHPGGARPA